MYLDRMKTLDVCVFGHFVKLKAHFLRYVIILSSIEFLCILSISKSMIHLKGALPYPHIIIGFQQNY